ncbi:MAG TPA: GNAT family N-acetyltransferase [Acidimicrobiales bacterium]|nr:GNAT family N-acetyltransferase [Acidimicrobiales bacterium]
MHVEEVPAGATHDLRRRVLRADLPDADVSFDDDRRPGAFHLGVFDDEGRLVGIGSFFEDPCPHRPGRRAWRLRGMAVEPDVQGVGVGTALLEAAVGRFRREGVEVLWAHGRDSALGFYERHGWTVHGDGYVTDETMLPHHDVVLDL